jgi:hypothetical protein
MARKALWTAVAERSGDTAFLCPENQIQAANASPFQSGVALRLPPQSKIKLRHSPA